METQAADDNDNDNDNDDCKNQIYYLQFTIYNLFTI